MHVTFRYNALTDCRPRMIAKVCIAPDHRLFMVYENHGPQARGMFLDPQKLQGPKCSTSLGELPDLGIVGPASLKLHPASETGHTSDTPGATMEPSPPESG